MLWTFIYSEFIGLNLYSIANQVRSMTGEIDTTEATKAQLEATGFTLICLIPVGLLMGLAYILIFPSAPPERDEDGNIRHD